MLEVLGITAVLIIVFKAGHDLAGRAAGDIEAKLSDEVKQELIELRKWKADHIGK